MLTAESGNQFSFSIGVIFSIFCYTFFFLRIIPFFFSFYSNMHISPFMFCICFSKTRLNALHCLELAYFHISVSFLFFFPPLSTLNCLQSYGEVPSAALDPQKTLNSSFLFALEHLYLGQHHECYRWREWLLKTLFVINVPFLKKFKAKLCRCFF